jgi:hypothetical protein
LDRARGSVEKEKMLKARFSFLSKIEVLSEQGQGDSLAEPIFLKELWTLLRARSLKKTTGVQLNGCAVLGVFNLTGVYPFGCAARLCRPFVGRRLGDTLGSVRRFVC